MAVVARKGRKEKEIRKYFAVTFLLVQKRGAISHPSGDFKYFKACFLRRFVLLIPSRVSIGRAGRVTRTDLKKRAFQVYLSLLFLQYF